MSPEVAAELVGVPILIPNHIPAGLAAAEDVGIVPDENGAPAAIDLQYDGPGPMPGESGVLLVGITIWKQLPSDIEDLHPIDVAGRVVFEDKVGFATMDAVQFHWEQDGVGLLLLVVGQGHELLRREAVKVIESLMR